ncbi:MAG: MBOAT family O-acyltransferase [Pseudobacter sp.]|uniref:MBOAT family O-acyltransferase n=1 Tax=Pseudobacter sp. TaxID=2045420 RepID=UPI003F7CD9F1
MLFNSWAFAIFLPVVFFLYWFATRQNRRRQNNLLLLASYVFYACWDYRFLGLLLFSTGLDYVSGLRISSSGNRRSKKRWLVTSIVVNLGVLGVFKYFNFFAGSFVILGESIGWQLHAPTLQILLPVGISFYTFHGLSYIIDIYKERIPAEKNFIDYAVFVCFFPLLVAGPIERATHLLPQIKQSRTINYTLLADGMRQILWGLFKKILIADNCALYTDAIFGTAANQSGSALALGALLFTIQIYADFSGYSDIALGTARLFGIELLRNFSFPYFSRSIPEFWRRWHISLSSWFRDYLYIPLGGSRGTRWQSIRNVFIVFVVSGFWHGANFTFIAWGVLHACYFLPSLLLRKNRLYLDTVAEGRLLPSLKETGQMLFTFMLVCFAWIFFRAASISAAVDYIDGIFTPSFFSLPHVLPIHMMLLLPFFFLIEWLGREKPYALAGMGVQWPQALRWSAYLGICLLIILLAGRNQPFIYFIF